MQRLTAAILAVRQEDPAPDLVARYQHVRQTYEAFDHASDAASRTPGGWGENEFHLRILLHGLIEHCQQVQEASVDCREALETPL
jgi:hypothetical protein